MTAGGYGSMRATDADRENVRTILADAHAQGRLDLEELDARSAQLMQARTYDQLAVLTADLPNRYPSSPPVIYAPGAPRGPNGLAIASLACGVGQFAFWLFSGIPAIILGHMARKQIRQTGEAGDGMALAGMILGYIGIGLSVLGLILFVVIGVWLSHQG